MLNSYDLDFSLEINITGPWLFYFLLTGRPNKLYIIFHINFMQQTFFVCGLCGLCGLYMCEYMWVCYQIYSGSTHRCYLPSLTIYQLILHHALRINIAIMHWLLHIILLRRNKVTLNYNWHFDFDISQTVALWMSYNLAEWLLWLPLSENVIWSINRLQLTVGSVWATRTAWPV